MKKLILIVLCLALFAVQTSYANPKFKDKTANQWLDSGLFNMRQEQYVKACNDFTNAINLAPDEAVLYYSRGVAYLYNIQFDLAYQDFSQAVLLTDDDANYYFAKATTKLFIDKIANDEIMADYNKAISLQANDSKLYDGRGKAYFTLQQYDKAIADYTTALKIKSHYVKAYTNRAESYINTKQYDLAKTDLEKALQLSSNNATTYYTLGLLYKELQQIDLAIENFNKALDIDPKYPDPYFAKAQIYGQYQEPGQRLLAINNYQLFIETASKNTNLDYCLNDYRDKIIFAQQIIPELHK